MSLLDWNASQVHYEQQVSRVQQDQASDPFDYFDDFQLHSAAGFLVHRKLLRKECTEIEELANCQEVQRLFLALCLLIHPWWFEHELGLQIVSLLHPLLHCLSFLLFPLPLERYQLAMALNFGRRLCSADLDFSHAHNLG